MSGTGLDSSNFIIKYEETHSAGESCSQPMNFGNGAL